jgi:hypothetical protein
MVCPVSVQERLRGWRCRDFSFNRRPYIGSRVRLTGGRRAHSSRRGDVLSPRPPTVLEMVMQCPGWCWDGGDGCTEPMATEVTGPAGPTSRRSPVRAWSSRPSSLRGLRRPLSMARCVGCTGVGGTVPRDCCRPCHTMSHSGGDGLTGGVGGTVPRRDSQARRGVDSSLTWAPANVSASNAPIGGAGMKAAGPRGPRARRNLARGGVQPPSETEPHPRGHLALERCEVLPVQHRAPRAKRSSARGRLGRLFGGLWARGFILRVFLVRLCLFLQM